MAAEILTSSGTDIRENLVTTAIKFLTNPNVQRCTMESKERFLRSKGLTDAEIHRALEKCGEMLDVPSLTSELMLFHHSRRSWFRERILPLIVYGGFIYGCYWFYKNCIRHILFVEPPKRKSVVECMDEVRKSLDVMNASISSLRAEVQAAGKQNALRGQMETLKDDITFVKGLLLNRNQFSALKTRSEVPSIPKWQQQSEEATSTEVPEEVKPHRSRSQRSESGGSNSSEGEQATKNSDSSLEIIGNSHRSSSSFLVRKKASVAIKPKRPLSSYMLWLNSARERIKTEHPGLKVTEIAKKGGEIWRAMKDGEKRVWNEMAAKAKEEYNKELECHEED